MWEDFIASRRNYWGDRYGFVRFLEVKDEKRLEQQLD